MKEKVFISHGDIILDKIYDGDLNLIKQDGGGSNWNTLYNLSYMGEKCYAIGNCGKDKEGDIAISSLKRYGINTSNKKQQIALWAYEISFVHPTKKEIMKFSVAPNGSYMPWKLFDQLY